MRPKVIITILVGSLAGFLILMAVRYETNRESSAQESPQETAAAIKTESVVTNAAAAPKERAPGTAQASASEAQSSESAKNSETAAGGTGSGVGGSGTGYNHAEYVEQRVAHLMDIAMNDDAASLNTILSELNNSDSDIRKGAVEAAIQFGSLDAIPKLEEAAARTEDAEEKKKIRDAIEFLKLPSFFDVQRTTRR